MPTCQQSLAFLDHSIEKSSSVFDIPSHFPSSPPIAWLKINQLPKLSQKELLIHSSLSRFVTCHIEHRLSSPITFSEGTKTILLAAC